MNLLRFYIVIIISLPFILYYSGVAKYIEHHDDRFDEQDRYGVARRVVHVLKHHAGVVTSIYGRDNLPADGGYIMYPNHQGKYDAVGIIYGHKNPCTILMDAKRSKLPLMNAFMDLIKGCRMNKDDVRDQVVCMRRVTEEVKSGRRYIIFPEGGYDHNKNSVEAFHAGSFRCAVKAKCPIVPVAVVDSYKVFESYKVSPVHTRVAFLPALDYEQYKDLSTEQIATIVRARIMVAIALIKKKRKVKHLDIKLNPYVSDYEVAKTYIGTLDQLM